MGREVALKPKENMNPKFKDLAFDAVIPSQLLFNENICPSCIKLYAFIRGLARLEGYCYATNAYLAECMNCDERHLQKLIVRLADEGFLDVQTDKRGINWVRKIYIGVDLNKCLRKGKNATPPCQKCRTPPAKMPPNKGYTIEDIQENNTIASSKPEVVPPKSKKQNDDVSFENLMKALKDQSKAKRAMEYWRKHEEWIRKKATKSVVGFLVDWIRNDRDLDEESHLSLRESAEIFADSLVKMYGEKYRFEKCKDGVVFIFPGGVGQYEVNFDDGEFKQKIFQRLEKMGLYLDYDDPSKKWKE